MEARNLRAALAAASLVLLSAASLFAAGHRTENFVVSAGSPQLAEEVGREAERFRKELAIEFLGKELPRWPAPCPITVQTSPSMGAGGATSFVFISGQPRDFRMSIQGSRERVLDSVLPHEVTHTIFATHFGQPLPRWCDEGACTTVEHESEKEKQHQLLYRFLTTNRGIAFNQMFAMKEYPKDILPLYAQGFSLCKYFIAQGGKRKFVEYVGKGMETNNWTVVTREMYGYGSLSELQTKWLDWVRRGCPAIAPSEALASHETPAGSTELAPSTTRPAAGSTELIEVAPQDRTPGTPPANAVAAAGGDNGSWYVRPSDTTAPPVGDASRPAASSVAPPTAMPPLHAPSQPLVQPPVQSFAAGPPPAANSPLPHRLTGQHLPGKDLHWNSPIGKGALAASGVGEQSVTRPPQPEQPKQIVLEWARGQGPGNTILPPGNPPPRAAVLPQPERVLR